MDPRAAHLAVLAAIAVGLGASGCARPKNPWTYAEPPAVSLTRAANPLVPGQTLIAVADFGPPVAPQLPWPNVGPEMSRALRRALFKAGYQVRIAPDIEKKVSTPGFMGSKPPASAEPPDIDFVIIGQVTDFHHTAALPKDASRWGLIGRRHEAVVAFEWKVVDVRNRRIIAIDHTYGTAESSGKKSVPELYAGLDPSAYLFWNTPLGRAAHDAMDTTVARMQVILPPDTPPPPAIAAAPPVAAPGAAPAAPTTPSAAPPAAPPPSLAHTANPSTPTVVQAVTPRQLEISGPGLAEGQEYFLALPGADGAPRAVRDCDTGRPLVVTIGPLSKKGTEGWVLGKAAAGVDLRGAMLLRELPPEPIGPAAAVGSLRDDT